MDRTVSAWVTSGDERLGVVGPFAVDVPWWADVTPVVAHLRQALGVDVLVLRLLEVDGGEGGRGGHVTYHVEALERPGPGRLTTPPADPADPTGTADPAGPAGPAGPAVLNGPERLRMPWARIDGLRELLGWAADALTTAGRPLSGPIRQHRTWNLSGLFRLPTARGPVWLKATPPFATDEATVIGAFAALDPSLVPGVVASGPRRILLEHLPGEDCWDASAETIGSAVTRLAAAQAELVGAVPPGLPDRRGPVVAGRVRDLLAGDVGRELTAEEVDRAYELVERWPTLAECGLPDTLVHGDFHPGNWRGDGGPPAVVDFADAHLGNPVLDGIRARDWLPAAKRPVAAEAWIKAWAARVPGCDPARALAIAEPLSHLSYAVRYQEFLDGIEPSERIYHLGDPAGSIRAALRTVAMD
ncbi:Ser/Thr protein kinase RdoA involved in Cpx stress response, MazF antagonist [Nonomuraea solani]|uniref:Ser/Thr protein kinase RdoA involved in Cpx stress response, MazF antagonist n=1 Tax=Nonomuraea solani TaxID=1144553 RepID=A0A1H6F275_9ACTN|nr:aminoglycoside phosphotransferase family protein [Nonomuraea solani]SEH03185.1 Ser/Thr protein kinase RdoA involved in Cpx stress response, MazF antagonist [Nonomuraea solani]